MNGEPIPTENQSVDISLPEWSEEDERILGFIIEDIVDQIDDPSTDEGERQLFDKEIKLLKSLPKRFNLHPKQGWCEEDNIMFENIILCLKEYCLTDEINWLKSLRSSWKPNKWRRYIWAVNLRFDYDGLVRYEDNGSYEIVAAGNKPKRQVNGEYILLKDIQVVDWKPSKEQMEALL